MTPSPQGVVVPAPEHARAVWRAGLAVLVVGFALALGVSFAAALLAPEWAWLFPAALLGGVAVAALPRRSETPLLLLLALFALVSGHSEGLEPQEVLFALAQFGYLAWWFWTRAVVFRAPLVRDAGDALMLAFLAYVPLSLGLTVLFRGEIATAATECLSLSLLGLYFPLREVLDKGDGLRLVVALTLAFGAVATVRVLGSVRAALSDAEYAWQVAQGRVPMNETLLYSASLLTLCLSALADRWRVRLLLLMGFTLFTLGLVMTQWRAYYIGWAVALGAVVAWGSGRVRWRVVQVGVLAGVVGSALAIAVLGETVIVAAVGIAERVLSIGTATSTDVSLLNRFLEYRAVWPRLMESPVFGHGPGVTFGFYDAIFKATWVKSYVHNTYLILWFKFGLIGLVSFLGVWAYSFATALRLSRTAPAALDRSVALFVAAALGGLAVSSLVSVALVTDDTAYNFAVLFALSAGLRSRALGQAGR